MALEMILHTGLTSTTPKECYRTQLHNFCVDVITSDKSTFII